MTNYDEDLPRTATPTDDRPRNLQDPELYRAWRYDGRASAAETDHEIDKAQWVDPRTQLDCLIVRHPRLGHFCGYVGVPSDHPLYEQQASYSISSPIERLNVHGGVTFAAKCQEDHPHEGVGVCHVPFPGRTDDIWWIGFDCAHSGDRAPWLKPDDLRLVVLNGSYKTQEYVTSEIRDLAEQIEAMSNA